MTPREYLSQVFRLEQKIHAKEIKAKEFEDLSYSLPGVNYDGIRVDGTKKTDPPFVFWLQKKSEVDRQIDELRKKQVLLKAEIMSLIEKLNKEEYQSLLVMRYLNFKTWDEISYGLSVTPRTVYRWHSEALDEVGFLLEKS